jgi:hypothetical protein
MLKLFKRLRNKINVELDSFSGRKQLAARQERHMESETQGSETGEVPNGWIEAPDVPPPCCDEKTDIADTP